MQCPRCHHENEARAYEELSETQEQLTQARKLEAIGCLAGGIVHDLTLTSDRGDHVPFFGVFLLSFRMDDVDLYLSYMLVTPDASGVTLTRAEPVQPYERALLYPTARFDIYFQR